MIYIETVRGSNSNICLVIFSPLTVDRKSDGYGWWNQLKNIDVSKVFVRDDINSWYLSQDNETLEIETIKARIADSIEIVSPNNESRKLFFIGPSMGGFAAFLYGSLLKADLCWGTSIEETLMLPGSISSRHLQRLDWKISLNEYLDPSIKYHLLVGELDLFDLFSASLLPDYVNVSVLGNAGHVVPVELKHREISISDVVLCLLKDLTIQDVVSDVEFNEIKVDILYYYFLSQNISDIPSFLIDSFLTRRSKVFIFNYVIAKHFYRTKNKEKSLEIIERELLNKEYNCWDIYHFIGLVYRDLGENESAIKYFRKSHDLNPNIDGNIVQLKLLGI